ncbi:MAG: VOC family protein, partial [Gemmobacter sp.]
SLQPPAPDEAGLFHAALLLPDRASLGAWLRHAADAGIQFQGFADHGVSEAVYFADPDGNGIEIYRDRPEAEWPRDADGGLAMSNGRLDLAALLAEAG